MLQKLAADKVRGLRPSPQRSSGLSDNSVSESFFGAVDVADVVECQRLLTGGLDPRIKDFNGCSPLHRAAVSGSVEICSILLKACPELVKSRSSHQDSPLHFAAAHSRFRIAEQLLDAGAFPNAVNNFGSTPVHEACKKGDRDVAELLLKRGADPLISDNLGNNPLMFASQAGFIEVLELLEKTVGEHDFPHYINTVNNFGNTALHFASQGGHIALLKLLLAHGANPSASNHRGNTPLHRAALFGHAAACTLLLQAGADARAINANGDTPTTFASQSPNKQLTQIFSIPPAVS